MEESMLSKSDFHSLTRREFVKASATVAAVASYGKAWSRSSVPDRAFEHGNPLSEFHYGQVEFQRGLHQAQLEQAHAVLMDMNEDSLLRPFRMAAGLPAPGNDLGGWYSSPVFGPTTFGQWLSALSRYHAATADEASLDKVKRLVKGFSQTTESTGKIYKGTEDDGLASYTFDKVVVGLADALKFGDVTEALDSLEKSTVAAIQHLPGRAIDFFAPEKGGGESYSIPENQFIAWQRGAGQRHLDLARQYLHDAFFNDLASGQNTLPNRHAYSHVNALCSAAKAYLVLGDEKYLKAAINGLAFVEQQSFVTGGWGPMERFLPLTPDIPPIQSLGDSIVHHHYHFETPCGSYAHFKLTRYLLRITKNPHYGDSMERVMYNTVLGALPLNKYGRAFYHSNYHHHARKEYFDGYGNVVEDEWPCCSGTLPQVAADYRISTYFRDREGVYVNLFIPSTLRWEQSGAQISLAQTGLYPLGDEITFDVTASRAAQFAIRLRIPEWSQDPTIRINGKTISQAVRSGTFVMIRREWKSGDRVELELPRKLELKAVDAQHPDTVALVCGPLVLFAVNDDTPKVTRAQLLTARQQSTGSPEWRADIASGTLRLVPFWAIKDEIYFTYLSV
jgi:DUF1680 family protein